MDSKTLISHTVYAPNLHLFAFHLWRGLTGETDSLAPHPKQLWERGDDILKALGFTERLDIYGYPENSPEPLGAEINLNPNKRLNLTGTLPNSELKITGNIYTHRLNDSYSLTVNLRRPEQENGDKTAEVNISFWRNLNTESLVFLPNFIKSSLGQTLLLTAFLPVHERTKKPEDLQNFARNCLAQVMPSRKVERPPLHKLGELFGSPFFEFGGQVVDGNLEGEAQVQPHIIIFLFRDDLASEKFIDAYRQFINLFYYRNKVLSAYRETRTLYRKTYSAYTQLEHKVKSFKQELTQNETRLGLTEAQLEDLKKVLKELAALDLEYARLLRNYKHCRNTISINTKNYQVTLTEIFNILQEKGYNLQQQEMDVFGEFSDRTSPYFQTRIGDELNYFVEGSSLADKAIASIRGIVEIEQTQRDRTRQQQNQQLQDEIQAWGVAIGTGAIIASTSGLMFEEPRIFPQPENGGGISHPFAIALFASFAGAILGWGGTKFLIWLSRRKGFPFR
ncbi:MAG: hypothetical protein EA414_17800 [Arthrospira sp. PLM2.Bin9]|nr:hypothetical protein [Arthrospira sp. PLM2.Bin9]TVU52362.1 MAG: hypothetical protein EA414_17800 [Arthrospira sp. PLM2.Bin9]